MANADKDRLRKVPEMATPHVQRDLLLWALLEGADGRIEVTRVQIERAHKRYLETWWDPERDVLVAEIRDLRPGDGPEWELKP